MSKQPSSRQHRTQPAAAAKAGRRVPIWAWIMIIACLLLLGAIAYYFLMPLDAPIPAGVETHYAGLERGYTEEGFPRLGSATAPVLVEDFSSYSCPHCRTLHEQRFENLLGEIEAGLVQFVFIPVPMIGSGADTAAKAAVCAGEQGQYWEMHDVLFYWQGKFLTRIFDERRIKDGAKNLGLDAGQFNACLDGDYAQSVVDAAERAFRGRGLSGTPTLFIDGEKVTDYQVFDALSKEIS